MPVVVTAEIEELPVSLVKTVINGEQSIEDYGRIDRELA